MKFLDIVINGYASQKNPLRTGIFVRRSGRFYEFTDGRRKFWKTSAANDKLSIVGNLVQGARVGEVKAFVARLERNHYGGPIGTPSDYVNKQLVAHIDSIVEVKS